MGNSLLDFVMSLARDPQVAAQYAADPAATLAAAGLPDVTTADVSSLMPMVTDSLAMSSPGFSGLVAPVADAANVWASGAATAAFDAFGIAPPTPTEPAPSAVNSIDHDSSVLADATVPAADPHHGQFGEAPAFPDVAPPDPMPDALPWADHADPAAVVDPHQQAYHPEPHPGDPSAFDLF